MLQPTLSGPTGFEQVPAVGSQVPATWHMSIGVQVLGAPLVQVPLWQVSLRVQALTSLHEVPLGFGEQTPAEPDSVQEEHWSVQA